MKTLITFALLLISTSISFAASTDSAQIVGDLKVDGVHFSKDGSTMYSANDLLKNKGTWSSSTLYSAGDVVQTQSGSYVCLIANTNIAPPNATYWAVLGTKGASGASGTNGLTSLISLTTEAPGISCSSGGVKIQVGIDSNGNGVLDIVEINQSQTKYVCNGASVSNSLQPVTDSINSTLSAYSSIISSKGTSITSNDIAPFYSDIFLDKGKNKLQKVNDQVTQYSSATYIISNMIVSNIISYNSVTNLVFATVSYSMSIDSVPYTGNTNMWLIYDNISNKWMQYGDQRLISISVRSGIKKTIDTSSTTVTPVLSVNASATSGTISQITISGPSLLSNPTILTKSPGNPNDTFYISNDGPINSAPLIGSVYTITVTKSDSSTVTYTETIRATTTESFNITNPTSGHAVANATLGTQKTVSWTLPTTFSISNVSLVGWVNDNLGGFSNPHGTVVGAKTSGTITLPTPTNGGTATYCGLGVYVSGDNGEYSIVQYLYGPY